MGTNWASRPACPPGNPDSVNLHKSLAAGATMPASKRVVKTQLKGSTTGHAKVPGLSNR